MRTRHASSLIDLVKVEGLPGAQLDEVENLTGVHREMFDHVIDRTQPGHSKTLNVTFREQIGGFESTQHPFRGTRRLPKHPEKLGCTEALSALELRGPLARIFGAAQPVYDPLSRISSKMQDQIANRVRPG